MKIILTESQLSEIIQGEFDEVRTARKERLGMGASHVVYPSKKNPNIVYKMGDRKTVNRWYEIFKDNPDIFPKVYKRGETVVKDFSGLDVKVSYVVLEKLDTKSFEDFWYLIDEYFDNNLQGVLMKYEESIEDLESVGKLIKENEGVDTYYKYVELVNMVDTIIEIVGSPDIHAYQFGFDKTGKLKCLDI